MIWAFLISISLLLLSVWMIIQQIKAIRNKKETIKLLENTLNAERAELVRFRTGLEDVKIIEEKRRAKNNEIDNTDDNDIASVLNNLLSDP